MCAAHQVLVVHRACSSASHARTSTSLDKQYPCQERSYDTGKQTEFSESQVFLCTSCATAGHPPRLTDFQEPDVAQSMCPSVRPAGCAFQVHIDATSALQSMENPVPNGCGALWRPMAPWDLLVAEPHLSIMAPGAAPQGAPGWPWELGRHGTVRGEIRNLCGLKFP